jgi:hypothetical protein
VLLGHERTLPVGLSHREHAFVHWLAIHKVIAIVTAAITVGAVCRVVDVFIVVVVEATDESSIGTKRRL